MYRFIFHSDSCKEHVHKKTLKYGTYSRTQTCELGWKQTVRPGLTRDVTADADHVT